jgi:hypothetical protein
LILNGGFIGNRDILGAGTDPFSAPASVVLLSRLQTNPGDSSISGYTSDSADLTALLDANAGKAQRLRFAETDNLFTFQLGVDNMSLETQSVVPEPSTWLLIATGVAALLLFWRQALFRRGRGSTSNEPPSDGSSK